MVKTSKVKLPPGMQSFPPLSAVETAQKRRVVSRSHMLSAVALRQRGKKAKKSPALLDPVELGMEDMRRLFENSIITPKLETDRDTPQPLNPQFVIYFDKDQVERLGKLKRAVLRLGYPLGDIMDVAPTVGDSSTLTYSYSPHHPKAVRELHAARARICWNMKFPENLIDVKDQETAKSLELWDTANPCTVEWAGGFFAE